MRLKTIIIVTLVILLLQTGLALSDEILSLADQLFEAGNYDDAITEYKRFVFFNPNDDHTGSALFNMGLAYRVNQKWQDAVESIEKSILSEKDADIADERRIILATTLIASGNYSLARLELAKVSEFSKSPYERRRSIYFDGIASIYMFDWSASRKAFDSFYSESIDKRAKEHAVEVDSILQKAGRSYKSSRIARILSTLFPGAGQVYAGNIRDGLNAFILNGVILTSIANSAYKKDYKDALLIFSVLSLRYYSGNIYKAEINVRKYNESLDRKNAAKVLELVSIDEPL